MEHIIEMKQEVVEKLMKTKYTSKELRAPFRKFTLTFPNSVFVTQEQVMADVLETILKSKGTTNAVLSPKEKARLEKMAKQYSEGICSLRVKCDETDTLQFSATLYDPMKSILMDYETTTECQIPLISKNEFSNTPLVTANALTNLIVGVIEYLNAPSKAIVSRDVKEPVASNEKKSKKSKKSKNKKTYIYKRYYVVDNIETNSNRKYERHTESWISRGHWRTYKSGKRVWIKEQVRGRGKNKVQTKEYKINKLDK